MKCIIAGKIYKHRGVYIMKDEQGITTTLSTALFKTFSDARQWIDKNLDGTNTKEPQIIGYWDYKKAGYLD